MELNATQLNFRDLDRNECVAILTLNRPQRANAFNAAMIDEITWCAGEISRKKNCRIAIINGNGKNFCAGADIDWMKSAAELSYDENLADAYRLSEMFEAICNLPMPSIAVAHGAVYGGAVGLVCCCDYAIGIEKVKFCLSEIKIGIIPAVILPHVGRKMNFGQLRRHALSARVISDQNALRYGLIEMVCSAEDLNDKLSDDINHLLGCSPRAQAALKNLTKQLSDDSWHQSAKTCEAISEIRVSDEGQHGLKSFLNKHKPNWLNQLPDSWSLDGEN